MALMLLIIVPRALKTSITIVLALYSVQLVPKNRKQCRVNKRRFTICVSVNIFLSPVYKTRVYVTFWYFSSAFHYNKFIGSEKPYNTVKTIKLWNRKTTFRLKLLTLKSPLNVKQSSCAVETDPFCQAFCYVLLRRILPGP